jgi:hypothetical protein
LRLLKGLALFRALGVFSVVGLNTIGPGAELLGPTILDYQTEQACNLLMGMITGLRRLA